MFYNVAMAKTNSEKQKDRDKILDPIARRAGFQTWNRLSTFVKNAETSGRVVVETSATGRLVLYIAHPDEAPPADTLREGAGDEDAGDCPNCGGRQWHHSTACYLGEQETDEV